eukprot:scaffold21180_cov31-Tisochrysis_lutea.AAC.2
MGYSVHLRIEPFNLCRHGRGTGLRGIIGERRGRSVLTHHHALQLKRAQLLQVLDGRRVAGIGQGVRFALVSPSAETQLKHLDLVLWRKPAQLMQLICAQPGTLSKLRHEIAPAGQARLGVEEYVPRSRAMCHATILVARSLSSGEHLPVPCNKHDVHRTCFDKGGEQRHERDEHFALGSRASTMTRPQDGKRKQRQLAATDGRLGGREGRLIRPMQKLLGRRDKPLDRRVAVELPEDPAEPYGGCALGGRSSTAHSVHLGVAEGGYISQAVVAQVGRPVGKPLGIHE